MQVEHWHGGQRPGLSKAADVAPRGTHADSRGDRTRDTEKIKGSRQI